MRPWSIRGWTLCFWPGSRRVLWQMAALGRGGQVAVYIYCGQEQLRDHLDLLSSWGR
ncbi:MAG: hypothetical protein V8S97_01650 [Oscillospiraceae bacterium]